MSDIKGIEISDVLGLSQPLTKLIEVCSSAIGTAYKPRHERKMTDAKVYEIQQIGEAIRENCDLPVNYQYRNIGINTTNAEDLMQRAKNRWLFDEMKRQRNIDSVADNAYDELSSKEYVSEKPVDEDWKTRFFDIAKDINSEEMQKLWGKLLAGEIEQPGSFSLRTLETIRNISRDEALVFNKIVPYLFHMGKAVLMTSSSEIYKKYGIKYDDILVLDECGLINSSGTLSITATSNGENDLLLYNEATALIVHGSEKKPPEFDFGIHSLTEPGRQLYRILNHIPNHEYFEEVAKNISQNAGEPVYLHKVNYITDDRINYEDDPYKVLGNSQ